MTATCVASWFSAGQAMLLVGQARYLQMGRRFRRDGSGVDLLELLMVLAVIVAVAVTTWLLVRYVNARAARRAHSPKALFAELCRAHRLDWSSRRLLGALARAHRLENPARLFVEPQCFVPERLASMSDRREQIIALRDRLFAAQATPSDEVNQ